MATKVVIITSCKGGVGKSTVAANLGYSLAAGGKNVLLIDCDFGLRNLDMMLGVEDSVIYDLNDVILKRVSAEDAMLRDRRCNRLRFIASPFGKSEPNPEDFAPVLCGLKDKGDFDYIILDSPGKLDIGFLTGSGCIDSAIIVASHQPVSIRAAERTGDMLQSEGIVEQYLIINSFDTVGAANGTRPGINEIIDKSYIRLLGVVPYEVGLMVASEKGELASEVKHSAAAIAFDNIAMRMSGESVPVFDNIKELSSKKILKRLFR